MEESKNIKSQIARVDQELKQLTGNERAIVEAEGIKQVQGRIADLKVERQALERQLTKAEKLKGEQAKTRPRLGEIETESIQRQKEMAEMIVSLMMAQVDLKRLQAEANGITGPLHLPNLDAFNILQDDRLTALFIREFSFLPPAIWKSMEQAWFEIRQEYYSPKRAALETQA